MGGADSTGHPAGETKATGRGDIKLLPSQH